MMIKNKASILLASLITSGVMVASGGDFTPAQAQSTSNLRDPGCTTLTVSNSVAWLKEQPNLKSATVRTAPYGETLWIIRDAYGYPLASNGWYMVRSATGRKYWVHHTVTRCGQVVPTTYNTYVAPTYVAPTYTTTYSYLGNCSQLSVNTSHAWLKAGPAMSYNTLRVATRGENLWRVGDTSSNYVNQQQGWMNVQTSDGNRYWVHNTRVGCAVSMPATTAPVVDNRPKPAPVPVRSIKSCVDVLACAVDVADGSMKSQYQQWMKQVTDMINNPLTKLAGEELCTNTMEKPVINALPLCKRN